jgi:hypothetical protein
VIKNPGYQQMRDFLTKPAPRRQQIGWIIQDDVLNFAGLVNGLPGL